MNAKELVAQVKNLPPVSHAALKLVGLLDQAAVSNEDVVQVLKYDSVLTAKLLRACNSPYYGFDEPVASVEQAVLILGHQQILHIVLSIAFGGAMSIPLPGYAAEAKELWAHSLTTAVAADCLARGNISMEVEPAVAFTAGLLHDIGKLVMSHALTPDLQGEVRRLISDNQMDRTEAEAAVLGTDHGEVGAALLESWRLPAEIVEAVANHHRPVIAPVLKLSAPIHVANCLAHLIGSTLGWEGFAVRADIRAAAALSVTEEKLEELMISVHESTQKVAHFMQLS
jgi:putative nucleotidyltransferase with HDIG domain